MTTWNVPTSAERAWEVLADPRLSWSRWWPGMATEHSGVITGPDGLRGAGSWARLRVRNPLGSTLRLRLDLIESRAPAVEYAGRAKLRVSGDLRGGASVSVSDLPGNRSEIRLTWVVTPMSGPPAIMARHWPALCRWTHAVVMRAGERGLTRHLSRQPHTVVSDITAETL